MKAGDTSFVALYVHAHNGPEPRQEQSRRNDVSALAARPSWKAMGKAAWQIRGALALTTWPKFEEPSMPLTADGPKNWV